MAEWTVKDGGLIEKDPDDVAIYVFDWNVKNAVAVGARILTSAFAVVAVRPPAAAVPTITDASPLGIQAGSRTTKVKVTGGTLGALYELTNTITTSESPAQTKARHVYVKMDNL